MSSSGHLLLSHAVVLLLCATTGTAVLPFVKNLHPYHKWSSLTGNNRHKDIARAEAACMVAAAMWNTRHAFRTKIVVSQILGVWEMVGGGMSSIRVQVEVLVTADIGTFIDVRTATADMYFSIAHNLPLIFQNVQQSGSFYAFPLLYHRRA
ncbi:hypothetical protein AXF42_Ash015901 [Apostasia shenzhenica]|uniref:Uncharacterized protein n=1 Tax=Apostasia shenzhenica TaxID=1088818 RepID=A0A2I0AWB4_9ASPA|nr:hypothetical protein AXF42_Ash015901 [Apostasia shenzhenica]